LRWDWSCWTDGFQDGKTQLAVDKYTAAIALNGSVAVYFANRAAAYQLLHDYDNALADCEKAIRLDPAYRMAYTWCDRNVCVSRPGESGRYTSYTRKGHAHAALGQLREAVMAHEAAVRLESESAAAQQALDGALDACLED
jgi:tetratricopeptide (TPR) repeat protein